jgi:DNA-binding CsgD family transcriptional regulator/PAS domain-containing protein
MLTARQAASLPKIYDAVLDEHMWPQALDAIAEAAESKSAAILASDNMGLPFSLAQGSSGLSPVDVCFYLENLISYEEPAWRYIQSKPVGTLVFDTDVWSDVDDYEQRPDNQWMISRWGVLRRAAVRLNASPGWSDSLTLQYCASMKRVPQATARSVKGLVPHVAKAVELHRIFSILRSRFNAVLSALDRVRVGVCIVSAHGDVIVSNKEAGRIFGLADGITLNRERRFLCFDHDSEIAISMAIQSAILTVKSSGDTPETLIAIKRRSGTHPFLVEVAPLSDGTADLAKNLEGAIVFIVDPDNPRAFSAKNIAVVFGLTSAEAAVCRHMVDGLTDKDIAEHRSVSIETVRSQVKSVYRKTNTVRRAELIRLTLSITPPIDPAD